MAYHIARRAIAIGALALLLAAGSAQAKDDLVIGVAHFPPACTRHRCRGDQGLRGGFRASPDHDAGQGLEDRLPALRRVARRGERAGEARGPAGRQQGHGGDDQAETRPEMVRWSARHHQGPGIHLEGGARPELRLQQYQSMEPCPQHRRDRRSHRGAACRQGLGLLRPLGRNPARTHRGRGLRQGGRRRATTSNRPPTTARRPRRACTMGRT